MGLSPQEKKEKELIVLCKKNDRNSQKKLFKLFYAYAFNVSKIFTYTIEDAEEVVNDCFIKLFSSIHSIDESKPLKFLIRRIIINMAIDNYRKNKKHYYHLDINELNEAEPQEDIINSLSSTEILSILNKLPLHHRLVFSLYEIENYSHEEIASELKISVNSSRVFLLRAKTKLRTLLSTYNND